MDWIDVKLWWWALWHPFREWRARRELMPKWIAEGRDPATFPRTVPITREVYDWAVNAFEDHQE